MISSQINNSSNRAICRMRLALMGPAFIAAIGYIDPGNFATNIQTGAIFGYKLLWVVVWANLMAMIIQVLSAKLGIATRKNLAELIRDHYPVKLVYFYWIQAEIIAMATDLAEFIGTAIGFKLILDISLFQGSVLTGVATFLILTIQRYGQKPLETIIASLLFFVAISYIIEIIFSHPNIIQLSEGIIVPKLPTSEAVFLAAGILGATIMPHVIYLHSSLTQNLHGNDYRQHYTTTKWDVTIAMTIAGFVNLMMMTMAAAVLHSNGQTNVTALDEAYLILEPLLNHAAATIFGLSLVASGLSSTVVGTLAGQVVMQGFVRFYIPLWLRRSITILPSFIVILIGMDPTKIMVISQILLSFGIALALVPLIMFTSDSKLMGDLVNTRLVRLTGWTIVVLVVVLNLCLMIETMVNLFN